MSLQPIIATGSIKLAYSKVMGLFAYDGIDCWRLLSPYLIIKWIRLKDKIPIFIAGRWIILGHWIVVFHKNRKVVHKWINLGERYSRDQLI